MATTKPNGTKLSRKNRTAHQPEQALQPHEAPDAGRDGVPAGGEGPGIRDAAGGAHRHLHQDQGDEDDRQEAVAQAAQRDARDVAHEPHYRLGIGLQDVVDRQTTRRQPS
jgi:hypothetical protein